MRTGDFSRLWPDLVRVKPQKVIFTGGEPLSRADIIDFICGLRDADPEHQVQRCLNTNGHLVTPDVARKLIGVADEVRVSLDALPNCNDRLRGEGNFNAAMRAIKYFRTAGFEPRVLVTVTAVSLPYLEDFLCFLIERDVTNIKLNDFRPIGRGKNHKEWAIRNEEVRAIVCRVWKRLFAHFPELPEMPEPTCQTNCGVGQFLNILPNGDVFPCHVLVDREFRCGNVRDRDLIDICQGMGLLGALSNLDFRDLAQQDAAVASLVEPRRCMGEVYSVTKTNGVWRNHLPLTPPTPKQ